jgi:hypothetical protein
MLLLVDAAVLLPIPNSASVGSVDPGCDALFIARYCCTY